MPAVSGAQQRLFGMARAKQEGKLPNASPEVTRLAESVTPTQAHDFAATKRSKLPEYKKPKRRWTE